MEEANKRNEARKFYTIACGIKANFHPQIFICKDREDSLIGKD
jgi:hypothetical protein